MKIRITAGSVSNVAGVFVRGDVVDMHPANAQALIDTRLAEAFTEKPPSKSQQRRRRVAQEVDDAGTD